MTKQEKERNMKLARYIACALMLGNGLLFAPMAEADDEKATVGPEVNSYTGIASSTGGHYLYTMDGYWLSFEAGTSTAWSAYDFYGGYKANNYLFSALSNCKVEMVSGYAKSFYGAYSSQNDNITGNKVYISGGTVGDVYGGYSAGDGPASHNTVTISAGATVTGEIHGAKGGASSEYNTVTINGGTFNGVTKIFGGSGAHNTVTINNGTFNGTAVIQAGDKNSTVNINKGIEVVNIWGGVPAYMDDIGTLNLGATGIIANSTSSPVGWFSKVALKEGFSFQKNATVLSAPNGTFYKVGELDIRNLTTTASDSGTMHLLSALGFYTYADDNVKLTKLTYNGGQKTGWNTGDSVVVKTESGTETGTNTVKLSYSKKHTVTRSATAIDYVIDSKKTVTTVNLGSGITWVKDGTVRTLTDAEKSTYTFNSSNTISAPTTMTFNGTIADNTNPIGQTMTMLAGASGVGGTNNSIAISDLSANYKSTTDTKGLKYIGAATTGKAYGSNNKVTFEISGARLDTLDVSDWTGTTHNNILSGWTKNSSGVNVTGSFATAPNIGTDLYRDIMTTSTPGFFSDDKIANTIKYQSSGSIVDVPVAGVTLSGDRAGGVKTTNNGENLTYYKTKNDVTGITLGTATWGTARDMNNDATYDFSGVTSIDASNLGFTGTAELKNGLNGSTNILTNATGLAYAGAITQPTNKTFNIKYTDATTKITYNGQATDGSVSRDGTNLKYTISAGKVNEIDLGQWNGTGGVGNLPTGWSTPTGGVEVDTGDFESPTGTDNVDIFTTDTEGFFNENNITGDKKYKDNEPMPDDQQGGVTISGTKSGGIAPSEDGQTPTTSGKRLTYFAESTTGSKIALGEVAWAKDGTARTLTGNYDFSPLGDNDVDATGLTFTFANSGDTTSVNKIATGDTMILLAGATGLNSGLTVAGSPKSQAVSYGINNVANLSGTLTGNVTTTANTVNYAVTGKTLDSVDISSWNGSTSEAVDGSWTRNSSGINVTGSGFTAPTTLGDTPILTATGGLFADAKIADSIKYQPSGKYTEKEQNITLSGKQAKGVQTADSDNKLVYSIGAAYIDNLQLGKVTYNKNAELLDKSSAMYNFSNLTSLDTSGFGVTMTDDQKKTAQINDSMTLVKGNDTLGNIAAKETGTSNYSYTPTTGMTVGGSVVGQVLAKDHNVLYQIKENKASTLGITNVQWDNTYARPDTEITYSSAVVNSSNIKFTGVDNLATGQTMILISNYGDSVTKTRGGVFTLDDGRTGKGTAYYDTNTKNLMYKVTLGAGETRETVNAVNKKTVVDLPDGQEYQGTVNGGEAQGDGESTGNEADVKGKIVTNTDGTGGDVNGGTSEEGDSKKNKADVEDSTIEGDVNGGKSENGNSTDNEAEVDHSNVGGDVNGGKTDGDGETKGNEANVKNGSKVTGNVMGGHSGGNGDCTGNAAEVEGSEVGGDVNGGQSDGNGNTRENKTHVKDSKVTGNVNGGHSGQNDGSGGNGESTGNTAEVEGSEVGGNVNGGRSEQGNANKNESTVSGGSKVTGDVTGGSSGGGGTANENKTTVEGGSHIGGNVMGGESNGGNTNKNETTVSGSTVDKDVIGGKTSGNGTSSENKATVAGGSEIGGSVTGGQSVNGNTNKNEVSVSDGSIVNGSVSGGKTTGTGSADNNTVDIDSSTIKGSLSGGDSNGGSASGNTVTVNNTNVGTDTSDGNIYGGKTAGVNKPADTNTVSLTGGTVKGGVFGGYSENGSAANNKVTVNGTNIRDYIYGGKSKYLSQNDEVYFKNGSVMGIIGGGCEESLNNLAELSDGTVEEHVLGGFATGTDGIAKGNKVQMTGGTVKGSVIGGYGNGTAEGNTVYLSGGTVQGNTITSAILGNTIVGGVYGGYGTGSTKNNSVYLYGTADVSNTALIGGTSEATGNLLNIGYIDNGTATPWTGGGQMVKDIKNFETLSFSVVPWSTSQSGIQITDGTNSDLSMTTVSAKEVVFTGTKSLAVNDTMTLLDQSAVTKKATSLNTTSNFTVGTVGEGTGALSLDNNENVIYKVESVHASEQTHNTVMDAAAGMTSLLAGNEFIDDSIKGLALQESIGTDGIATYAKLGGSDMRQETGSHVNLHTWNGILAVGHKNDKKKSSFEYGAFLEYGTGNYTTYNGAYRGDGSSRYTGGGVLGKWQQKDGMYVEGSLRGGRIHSDASNLLRDGLGNGYSYSTDAPYWGVHLGVGKEMQVNKTDTLDVYAKYFFNRRGSVSFDAGGHYELDAVNSNVLRVGTRYTVKKNKNFNYYGGLAVEHEFSGKATGTADNMAIRSADISGTSLRWELGATFQPDDKTPMTLDLNLTGFAGKKRGISGGVSALWHF